MNANAQQPEQEPVYEKRTEVINFSCKPSEKARWGKLWGKVDREFSFNIRRILNAEADRVEVERDMIKNGRKQ